MFALFFAAIFSVCAIYINNVFIFLHNVIYRILLNTIGKKTLEILVTNLDWFRILGSHVSTSACKNSVITTFWHYYEWTILIVLALTNWKVKKVKYLILIFSRLLHVWSGTIFSDVSSVYIFFQRKQRLFTTNDDGWLNDHGICEEFEMQFYLGGNWIVNRENSKMYTRILPVLTWIAISNNTDFCLII